MDDLATHIQRMIQDALVGHTWVSPATIRSFTADPYEAKVRLEPSGEMAGPLPILVPFHGCAPALRPGTGCTVLLVAGVPYAIAGVHYTARTAVPAVGIALGEDMHLSGTLSTSFRFVPPVYASLPPATADWANSLVALAPAGSTGSLHFCQTQADGSHAWKTVTLT